jgi:putative redox protein
MIYFGILIAAICNKQEKAGDPKHRNEAGMKLFCHWNDKMKFTAEAEDHKVQMDANRPIGDGSALTPKQLLLAGICGCTGMDVVALMKKHKQPLEALEVEGDATPTEGVYPGVFKEIRLTFKFKGDLNAEKVLESVMLSQTKYCGVSAMVSKAVPISYIVELNEKNIGAGHADFN